MVLCRPQLAYLYYLEISLTFLQTTELQSEFLSNSIEVPKSEKQQ